MSVKDLSSGIESIYQASSTGTDWASAGGELFRLLDVDSGTLRVHRPDGSSMNLLRPESSQDPVYLQKYLFKDPLREAAERIRPTNGWLSAVKSAEDLIPRDELHRSDFYQNYAKPNGQVHVLVAGLGDPDRTIISFFREKMTFNEEDKSRLAFLLPHVRRAVELHNRLNRAQMTASIGEAALEATAGSVVVLDTNSGIVFANASAEEVLRDPASPLLVRRHPTPRGVSGRQLTLRDHSKASRFRALVEDAAQGGSGGAMRLEIDAVDELRQLAVVVTPQPVRSDMSGNAWTGTALVLLKELSRAAVPRPSLLSELFGLSIAESAVGVALLGGQTAENVARERDVSLETVRSQIRTVLRKTEAANLRDFERIGALLATLGSSR